MKRVYYKLTRCITALAVVAAAFTSCEYQEFADADYPEQTIYIPAAYYNPFMINEVPGPIGSTPTPGYPVRFNLDNTNNLFNVLLGVYRAGIDSKGAVMVDIAVNTDTITKLITAGTLPADTEILPSDRYTIATSVQVKDGEDLGKFNLEVDRDFLRAGYPDKKYAIGVGISTSERKVNEDLSMVIIMIDTKIMKPTASFTFSANVIKANEISFTNTSIHGKDYSWNFGDGSTVSTAKNPVHTYASAGSYTVTLTVQGPTGEIDQAVVTNTVDIASLPGK